MPSVKPNETRSSYMSRCVPYVMGEAGTTGAPHAVAKCAGMWLQHLKRKRVHNVRGRNTIRMDPTRTAMIRKRFMIAVGSGFKRLSRAITKLIVEEDAFGLKQKAETTVRSVFAAHSRYEALLPARQLEEFRAWLKEQIDQGVLRNVDAGAQNWLRQYIDESYKKGAGRAFDDTMKKYAEKYPQEYKSKVDYYQGSRDEFLRSSFNRPASVERVSLLATRAYTDLKGVTQEMSTKLNRIMTDSIIQGRGPRETGRELNKIVDGYKNRGLTIARTETIRAHADGQLEALKNLGVEEVGVMVEWSSASDDLVCGQCADLDGAVMKITEASHMIPLHPNCRCCWIPANVGEEKTRKAWYEKDKGGRAIWRDVTQFTGRAVERKLGGAGIEAKIGKRLPSPLSGKLKPAAPLPPAELPKPVVPQVEVSAPFKPAPIMEPGASATQPEVIPKPPEAMVAPEKQVLDKLDRMAGKNKFLDIDNFMPYQEQEYSVGSADFMREGKVVRMQIEGNNKLVATQEYVDVARVKTFVESPEIAVLKSDPEDKLAKVVQYKSRIWVHDGHTRIVAAQARGESYIDVILMKDPQVPGSADLSGLFQESKITLADLKAP